MRATATLLSVLVLAGCGNDEPQSAEAAPARPAAAADLVGSWTATFGSNAVELAFTAAAPADAGLELSLVQNGDLWGVGRVRVDAAQGTLRLDEEPRCSFATAIAGDVLTLTSAARSCLETYLGEMLTGEEWRRRSPVPGTLAGTWTATIAGERVISDWTLEFNATGGTRNGPSMVLDSDAYGTDVRAISVWVTGPKTGGVRLGGRRVRGCREFSYVADGDQLTLAATGDRCPHTHLHQVLSRGSWERSR